MAALGPFEPAPRLAAGVSGGADSMALALLADAWARERGGSLLALIVDHGLRATSAAEAAETAARLGGRGIAARVLTIAGLAQGPALAERARTARFHALIAACAAEGILHLLLGHHAADQAETVLIRALGGSGPAGMAGMASLVETPMVRILRPLLGTAPADLRATLIAAGVDMDRGSVQYRSRPRCVRGCGWLRRIAMASVRRPPRWSPRPPPPVVGGRKPTGTPLVAGRARRHCSPKVIVCCPTGCPGAIPVSTRARWRR